LTPADFGVAMHSGLASVLSQEIGWEEHNQIGLFGIEWVVNI